MWGNNNSKTITSFYTTATTTEANRPVRQRKNVTHYSDDNPQTFTVKKNKGQPVDDDDDDADGNDDESKVILLSREKQPKIQKKPVKITTTSISEAAEVMEDDIMITSTGRIVKRPSSVIGIVTSSSSSKKRRASMTNHLPSDTTADTTNLQKQRIQPRDVVKSTTTPIPKTMEYGINPRTGKMDKRFKKKQPIHDDDGNGGEIRVDDSSSTLLLQSQQRNKNSTTAKPPPQSSLSSSHSVTTTTTSTNNRKRKVTSTSNTNTNNNKNINSSVSSKLQHTSTTTTANIPSSSSLMNDDENDNDDRESILKDSTAQQQPSDTFCNETISLSHTAALQPILPLPILLPSLSSAKKNNNKSNNVRISTTSALWSERVVPPVGLTSVSKGPTWKLGVTVATASSSTQQSLTTTSTTTTSVSATTTQQQPPHNLLLPPPPITWFALREDDPSYAITGSVLGCLSLYDLSAAAPDLRPISVIQSTRAAQREQQSEQETRQRHQQQLQQMDSNRPIAKRTYVSYPDAIVQCHWYKQLLIVLTADEVEILQLPSTSSLRYQESSLYGIQTIAYWSLTIFNDPSLHSLTNDINNNISTASGYMWKRFNNSNRTTQSPCFSVKYIQNSDDTHTDDDSQGDYYNIFWTTRSSDTFNPTLLKMTVKPVVTIGKGANNYSSLVDRSNNNNDNDNNNNSDNNEIVTMKSILIPSTPKDGSTTATSPNHTNSGLSSSSSSSPETSSNHWRCWAALCEQHHILQQQQQQQPQDDKGHSSTESNRDVTGRQSFLMIAQTGPETIELLRCKCYDGESAVIIANSKSDITDNMTIEGDKIERQAPLSVWQFETIQVMYRQSIPFGAATRSYHHQNSNTSNGSNGANDTKHSNGWNNNYQFLPIPDCCLQQYSEFTFVTGTGSRGIRMYRTETLEAVATFGENVQVHGRVAVWSRCAWIKAGTLRNANVHVDISSCNTGPTNSSVTSVSTFGNLAVSSENAAAISTIISAVGKKKLPWWIERDDELAIRQREKDNQSASSNDSFDDDEYWLIGIPHPYRGPSELKTTLYLWKPGAFAAAENEITTTLQLPPGGCFGDYYATSKCQRMVCVGAESSQMYVWDSVLRSDFAGIMYPVGYKVITDNLEYVEDEDELDEVVKSNEEKNAYDSDDNDDTNDAKSLDPIVDSDLAEAMRLSLLELQRQQSNASGEEKISVLCENFVDNDTFSGDFIIPPWPDRLLVDANEPSSPGSPLSRHRALSNSSFMDSNSGFENSFLNIIPHVVGVRDEVKLMTQKRILRKDAADSGVSILDKPKPKAKRARNANVEVILQSSVDGVLRRRMDDIRTIWTDGAKTTMSIWSEADDNGSSDKASVASTLGSQITGNGATQIQQNESLKIFTLASQEEQSLALELLHLSPSNVEKSIYHLYDNSKKTPVQCSACAGRFVLHTCGIREKPIDYDEIARLEQEEREREEEEKQNERTLKRRQAEAKRKESRRKKKEDIKLKKCEENEQLHGNHRVTTTVEGAWGAQRSFHEDYAHSPHGQNIRFQDNEQLNETSETSSLVENSNTHDTNYGRYDEKEMEASEYSNAHPWARKDPNFEYVRNNHNSIRINGTEVTPSTSLHPMDALEALAGLAGSMAKPVPIKEAVHNINFVHTSTDDDRYNGHHQTNGYGNHTFDETRELKSPTNMECGISHRFYSDSADINDAQESDASHLHDAPIAHVDYRDGKGGLTQLEPSLPVPAPVLTPPLHKPILDPSLDQAILLVEMAETAVAHGSHHFQRSFQNESAEPVKALTSDDMYRKTLEQSPEAEALLALALSASPNGRERPTIQWSASNEVQQPLSSTSTDQAHYTYSPSSQRSCFGSTTSSTHAIVVSQFLQQPMAASLTNATYDTINDGIHYNNVNVTADGGDYDTNTTSVVNSSADTTSSLK